MRRHMCWGEGHISAVTGMGEHMERASNVTYGYWRSADRSCNGTTRDGTGQEWHFNLNFR
jgi:hypothetical protein